MKFGSVQYRKFGAAIGAYSIVTPRENQDSQITLTDYEAELIISYFGRPNLQVGNVTSNPTLASKPFYLYPRGEQINLNVVFPKPNRTELRLYISKGAGYKPEGGSVWFVFVKDRALWIGAMPEKNWRSESSELKKDDFDSIYQDLLDETDEVRITRLRARDTYSRDRKVALARMEAVDFRCEYNPEHKLFISRFSRNRYLEAHHLVPMGMQNVFSRSLDVVENICCLCPWCHRAIHHADELTARNILGTLAEKRQEILTEFSLSTIELYSLYAIEEIK